MSKYLGDFAAGDTIDFKFTTFRPSTGAAFTLGGTPAISVYKDNSTTQSTAGVTLTVDFDSVTGLHHVRITTSSDGTFYADASQFEVVITTGTVDSVSVVGSCVGRFTLRAQAVLYPTTAGRKLDVSSTGEAGIDFANIGSPTTTVNLSGTTIQAVTDMVTANAIQISGDATAADNLEAAADGTGYNLGGGSIVAASVSGAVNSVTSAVTVGTINADVITASSIAEGAAQEIANTVWSADMDDAYGGTSWGNDTLGQRILKSNDQQSYVAITGSHHVAADIHELQATALVDIAQAVLTEATSTDTATYAAGDVGNVLGRLHSLIEADSPTGFRYTTQALEQAPSGGGGGGTWELNAEQTTGLKRMISAIVGVGGETATPGVLEFDMIGETTTLRITQSTDGNDRLTVEEV